MEFLFQCSTNSKIAYSLHLTSYQAIKLKFPEAKLAMRVVLTRFANCLQNLNIARMEHAASNSGFAKTSWEQKFVSVKKATRTNILAVQVISNGNRTEWSLNCVLLAINHKYASFRGSQRGQKSWRKVKIVWLKNLFEKRLTGLFLFGRISHSFFSHFNSKFQFLLKTNRMGFCLVQQMRMLRHVILFAKTRSWPQCLRCFLRGSSAKLYRSLTPGYLDLTAHALRANRTLENGLVI